MAGSTPRGRNIVKMLGKIGATTDAAIFVSCFAVEEALWAYLKCLARASGDWAGGDFNKFLEAKPAYALGKKKELEGLLNKCMALPRVYPITIPNRRVWPCLTHALDTLTAGLGMPMGDSLHLAIALENKARIIVTLDRHFKAVGNSASEGIDVVLVCA